VLAILMGIGAVFGALNTMYSAVASRHARGGDLARHRVRTRGVVVSVLAESLVLALAGALIGAGFAWASSTATAPRR
jgi:putative ABC transport system permease protein